MNRIKTILDIFKEAGQAFGRHKVSVLAAALAYYTVFSLAPLLVFSVFAAGLLFGEAAVSGQIVEQIQDTVGREAAVVIQNILHNASQSGASVWATILSTALLIFGASGVFGQLKQALNIIWEAEPPMAQGLVGVLHMIKARALTFGMVLLIGALLVTSLVLSTVINALDDYLLTLTPAAAYLIPLLNLTVSPLMLWLLFSLIFKILPDTRVRWRDVWLGAAVTMLLFAAGFVLINIYLSYNSAGSVYGAASSLIIVLLWIYYSAQIFLFGAEFTQVYHKRYGQLSAPAASVPVVEQVLLSETAVVPPATPAPRLRQNVTAGLVGLGTGLLIAFIRNLRRS